MAMTKGVHKQGAFPKGRKNPWTYEVLALDEAPSPEDARLPHLDACCQSAMDPCEAAELCMTQRVSEGAYPVRGSTVLRVRRESNGPPQYERGEWVYVKVDWSFKGKEIAQSEVVFPPGGSTPCPAYKAYCDTPGFCEHCGHADHSHPKI